MQLIKLTLFNPRDDQPERLIYINAKRIISINTFVQAKQTEHPVTVITYAAGTSEDDGCFVVNESIEDIVALLESL